MTLPVHLLVATILPRRTSVEWLLSQVASQTRVPDTVHLVLDGYGQEAAPTYPDNLQVVEYRTLEPSGPGGRWRVAAQVPPEAILCILDDDLMIDAEVIAKLVAGTFAEAQGVSQGTSEGASAQMGFDFTGRGGFYSEGEEILCAAAGVMAVRAHHLQGLDAIRQKFIAHSNFDPLGDLGDDEAVVSAHLWAQGVKIRGMQPVSALTMWGSQTVSQSARRRGQPKALSWQRHVLRQITGWPWPEDA